MNIDRALVTKAVQVGGATTLLSHGIEERHFANTPDGQQCAEVFSWITQHARTYNAPPSQGMFRERWPTWQGEPTSDPLDALIAAFKAHVKRRAFSAKITELAQLESDPRRWDELDQLMLDAARDLSALVPAGTVGRMSEMESRIVQYEHEKANPDLNKGWKLGIPPFDEITNGIRPGNLVTIAGFSGLGKSLLSQWILMNALEQGANGLLCSLEMTKEEIFERLDTMVMNFSHKLLGRRELPDEQVDLWRRIAKQFSGASSDIIIKDRMMGTTVDRIYAEISRYKPDICVVDYVQLMKVHRRSAAQWETLVEVTNDLKGIALATECAIVMVSQDGRGSAQDGSTEQNMGGSISVYQAADLYLGLHQTDELYAQDKMEVRLLKNRRGEKKRQAYLKWKPATMDVEYVDPESQQSAHTAFLKAAA